MKELKDADAVVALEHENKNTDALSECRDALTTAKDAMEKIGGVDAQLMFLALHFGKPVEVNDLDERQIGDAIRRNIFNEYNEINEAGGHSARASVALKNLENTMGLYEAELSEVIDIPVEINNQDFWEKFLMRSSHISF